MSINYTAPPTLADFHMSDNFARYIIGPLGSGKTHGMIMECLRRASEQEPDEHGIARTRCAVVRNTLPQLRQTVIADWMNLLRPISFYKVSENTIYVRFMSGNKAVELDVLFLPLETKEDQRRLLSLQLSFAWVSEFRELDYEIIAALMGRVGRYPSKANGGCTWDGIFGESNPFSRGSKWHDNLVAMLPDGWSFYHQPSGLSEDAENRENLPPDYYERIIQGNSEEWIKVHVHSEFGDDLSGQVVFSKAFNLDTHVSDAPLMVANEPIIVGLDLGRTPTAILMQPNWRGTMNILAECTSEDTGLELFCQRHLRPLLSQPRFLGRSVVVIYDPAGAPKNQMTEDNAESVLTRFGLASVPAPTNDLDPRLNIWFRYFGQMNGGHPGIILDPSCVLLKQALAIQYKYARLKTGRIEDKPEKKHPWSDLVDAGGYGLLGHAGGKYSSYARAVRRLSRGSRPAPPVPSWRGYA